LGEPMPVTQQLDALREVGWHLVAFCNNVQFALLLTAQRKHRGI
jgi:hypothetical protein